MTPARPLFFHISPDWCGEDRLAQIFRRNGHKALCHEKGALATEIHFARARRRRPLADHGDVTLFAGLHRAHLYWRPPLEAWRAFAFLDRHFPQAHFILTTRAVEDWMLDRMVRAQGVTAACYAHHLDIPQDGLYQRWTADWHDHIAAVEAHFGDDPRLIRVDIDRESPAQFARRLSALLPMPKGAEATHWIPPEDGDLQHRLRTVLDRPLAAKPHPDPDFVEDVAAFCLKGLAPDDRGLGDVSPYYAHWDGDTEVSDRDDKVLPYVFAPLQGETRPTAVARFRPDFKHGRAEGVINDILRLGRRDPVHIDMQDARRFGSDPAHPLGVPVLCHNRREGARNAILWPLPGQHEIAAPGSVSADSRDLVPWDQKQDRLVWRGHISGTPLRRPGQPAWPSHQLLERMRAPGASADEQAEAFDILSTVPRMDFLRHFADHPDFDIGLALAWRFRDMADHPLLARYVRPREPASFFHSFRYQITLSGYDHGSNFLGAINSQSVLFKVEDGWQVYYLGRFKPWQHYIPVAEGYGDLEDKLAWARANPDQCQQMSAAARSEVARFANPAARRAILARILDGIAEAG